MSEASGLSASERVMVAGFLPPAPAPPLVDDGEIPVALWRSPRLAAVLLLSRDYVHGAPVSQYVDFLKPTSSGWRSTWGMPGSDWRFEYDARTDVARPELTGFCASTLDEAANRLDAFWGGIAPEGVTLVRCTILGTEERSPVEPVSGAFLIHGTSGVEPTDLTALP